METLNVRDNPRLAQSVIGFVGDYWLGPVGLSNYISNTSSTHEEMALAWSTDSHYVEGVGEIRIITACVTRGVSGLKIVYIPKHHSPSGLGSVLNPIEHSFVDGNDFQNFAQKSSLVILPFEPIQKAILRCERSAERARRKQERLFS